MKRKIPVWSRGACWTGSGSSAVMAGCGVLLTLSAWWSTGWGQQQTYSAKLPTSYTALTGQATNTGHLAVGQASDLIAFGTTLPGGEQQLTVLDVTRRVMAVYQVLPTTGEIALVSVRNIRLDLSIDSFNSHHLPPEEISKIQSR